MRYIDCYNYPDVKPDEKEYKESIISFLCDHFYHSDIDIILTNVNNNKISINTKNTIVFLSGNEYSIVPSYADHVKAIFTDFWLPSMPQNIYEIPLGFNERSDGRFIQLNLSINPISQRNYDITFCGSLHGNSANHRVLMLQALQNFKKYNAHIETYNDFFYGEKNINTRQQKYQKVMLDSKISLCPGGAKTFDRGSFFSGWETYRFNESLRYGNIIICNYSWSQYYSGPNVFYIDNWSDLTEKYIDNIMSKDLDQIQLAGIQYYKKHTSRFNVLKNIISIIEKNVL